MGYHDALLRRLGHAYAERARVAVDALDAPSARGCVHARYAGGSSLWLRFPENVDTRALAAAAEGEGVLIEPGDIFFSETCDRHISSGSGFRRSRPNGSRAAIERLASVVHAYAQQD